MSDRRTFLETIKEIASSIKKLLEAVNVVHAVRRAFSFSKKNKKIISGRSTRGTKLSGETQKGIRALFEALQQYSQRVLQGRRCQASKRRFSLLAPSLLFSGVHLRQSAYLLHNIHCTYSAREDKSATTLISLTFFSPFHHPKHLRSLQSLQQ